MTTLSGLKRIGQTLKNIAASYNTVNAEWIDSAYLDLTEGKWAISHICNISYIATNTDLEIFQIGISSVAGDNMPAPTNDENFIAGGKTPGRSNDNRVFHVISIPNYFVTVPQGATIRFYAKTRVYLISGNVPGCSSTLQAQCIA
jgi:hypothetical protein